MLRWRVLFLAATLGLAATAPAVDAQTVFVRTAPAGAIVELQLNAAVVATDTANAEGETTLVVPGSASRPDIDANVYVDSCGMRRRILLVQPGIATPPPDAACIRRDIPGIFLVKAISTIVVTVEGPSPRLLLRQGPFNPKAPPRTWTAVPSGLMISAGGGLGTFSNVSVNACGSVAACEADDTGWAYSLGAEFWFGRYVAIDAGLIKPPKTSAAADATFFTFTDALDATVVTLGAKVGVPAGPVRFYGRGGMTYQQSVSAMAQTIPARIDTVENGTIAVPAGSVALEYETTGLAWYVGGGLEMGMTRHVALYAEGNLLKLKGSERGPGEGVLDDRHVSVLAGMRVRLGK